MSTANQYQPKPKGAFEVALERNRRAEPKHRTWKTRAEKLDEAKEQYRLARSSRAFHVTRVPPENRTEVRKRDLRPDFTI